MFARMNEDDLLCYLKIANETKVWLYEHFGFKAIAESTKEGGKTLVFIEDAM